MSLPPGPSAPRQWQSLQYGVRPYPFFTRAHERYGDVFTVKVLRETWVIVADPASAKAVLTMDPSQTRSGEANYELRPVIGTRNVLLLDGAEHLQRRKLVLPPFHGERLQAYRETMAAVAREHVATWPRGEPFPLLPCMQAITLEIILRAIFGARADEAAPLRDSLRTLQNWLTGPQGSLTFLLFGADGVARLPKFRRLLAAVDDAVAAQIERRRRDPGDDVLSMLLQTDGLTDQDVRDELLTLLIAGHETSSAGLAWSFEGLLRHPEALERVGAREAGWAAGAAIESLRLHPPVALGGIRRLLAPLEVTGHTLPAGATVAPSSILLHRRPELYPDPHAFKPERWLDRKPGTYEWVPFGGSVRRCIGASFAQLEMEVVLEEVAARLALRAPSPEPERVWRRGIVIVPARGALAVA